MTNVTGVRESALQSVLFNAETESKTSARKQGCDARRDAPAGWRHELKRKENVDWPVQPWILVGLGWFFFFSFVE